MKRFSLLNVNQFRRPGLLVLLLGLSLSLAPASSARAGGTSLAANSKAAAKAVVSKLVAGDVEGVRADFNEEMRQGLTAEKMREVWAAAIQYHGNFRSQGEASQSQQQGYDVYVIRCEMERSPMDIVVAYDQNGKIGGLWLRPSAA